MSGLGGAACAKHPDSAAVEVCARCGGFLCAECVEYLQDEVPACDACAHLARHARPPAALKASPFLGLLGLSGLAAGYTLPARLALGVWLVAIPIGVAGLALSIQHGRRLSRAENGRLPGFGWAIAGRVVGLIHAAASALFIVGVLWVLRAYLLR